MKPSDLTDPALQSVAVEALPAIEAHELSIDEISSDLMKLESYLQNSTVRVEVIVAVPNGYRAEQIGWTKADGQWRIRHLSKIDLCRPLIETKAAVRIRCQKALPALLSEIAKAVST